ncbi:hypothetical protein [Serinicoccus sp. CUA-874]|nr:hypothetical protein [Serinicoccus sp. CUA-874]
MVVGLALLTSLGLRRFHLEVGTLADPTDTDALLDAAVVQVQTVLTGAGYAAALAAVVALALGVRAISGTRPDGRDAARDVTARAQPSGVAWWKR